MSMTPETDAAVIDGYTFCQEDMRPAIAFCANLERERDDARAELAAMITLADRLAEALKDIKESAKYIAKKDYYLSPKFDPCRLAGLQIIGNAKQALSTYEKQKQNAP